jgi:hypothetical protein
MQRRRSFRRLDAQGDSISSRAFAIALDEEQGLIEVDFA